jgi:phosphomannomutase
MEINPSIFRSYDIRGAYPAAVNEKVFFYLGQALSQMIKGQVVVGFDARHSSPSLYHAFIRGLSYSGGKRITILPVGMITTPELYFLVNKLGAGAGFSVTASHNPGNENGLKMVGPKAVPIFPSELKTFLETKAQTLMPSPVPAKIHKTEAPDYYHQLYAAFLTGWLKLKKPLTLVIDASDGVVGLVMRAVQRLVAAKKIPLTIHLLNDEPNGAFPAHGPSPLAKGALDELSQAVVVQKADCGAIFDSDGDRILLLDEKGVQVAPDAFAILLSQTISGKVVVDPRAGFLLLGYLQEHKRKAVLSRVGHAFFKKALRETGASFGAELSGHYYFKNFFGADSGLFTLVETLSSISRLNKPLSGWLSQFPEYYRSGEINFKLKNTQAKDEALAAIEERYKKEATATSKLDGLRMEFDSWWLLVRPSGNEDILRLYVEAKSQQLMKEKIKELSKLIDAPAA